MKRVSSTFRDNYGINPQARFIVSVTRALQRHFFIFRKLNGVQGWRSGESTRLPPMCPGFDSETWRHMWVETKIYFIKRVDKGRMATVKDLES